MDRSEWEHLIPEIERDIDSVRIVCVQLSRAGEISLTERLGNYTVVKTLKPDSPYYFALLEVVGPLEPGDSRDFVKIDPAEETFTAEMVEEVLLGTDIFERLEVDQDGSVRIFSDGEPVPLEFSASSQQRKVIERHVGELKPGDVVNLKGLKD